MRYVIAALLAVPTWGQIVPITGQDVTSSRPAINNNFSILDKRTTGVATISCAGNPGNTVGAYRQQCQTVSGTVYACTNQAGCSVSSDWTSIVSGATTSPTSITNLCVSTDGSASASTCSASIPITTCTLGMEIVWTADVANTTTRTLNAGCGAKSVLDAGGNALSAGLIGASSTNRLRYDGTAWRLPVVVSTATGGAVANNLSVGNALFVAGAPVYGGIPTGTFSFLAGSDAGSTLTAAASQRSIWANRLGKGCHLTEIWCQSDTGTPSLTLTRNGTTPAFVQAQKFSAVADGTTVAVALGTAATVGNAILVGLAADVGSPTWTATIADGLGTTYTSLGSRDQGGLRVYLYCGVAAATGTATVTATYSRTLGYRQMIAAEFSGTTCTLDGAAVTGGNWGVTSVTTASLTTAYPNDLLVSIAVGSDNTGVYTAGSGYTIPVNGSTSGADDMALQYQSVATSGSYTASISVTPAENMGILLVGLKAAGSVLSSDLTCTASGASSSTFATGADALAAGSTVDLRIVTPSTAKRITVVGKYTVDQQ